jgi:osmotically-inducible protein OsmY
MTMSKTDQNLKQQIEEELRWDPKVNAAQIGVAVDKGVVTLLGSVDTYPDKWSAEDAVKRVNGVRAVAQDLTVKVLAEHQRTDSEIATAVLGALKWDVFVPASVTAKVERGIVTLEGEVTWNYQRDAALRAVRTLTGVTNIHNYTRLKPHSSTEQVEKRVADALKRQASADAQSIHVSLSGSKVTLSGNAASWQAIEDAKNAAWAAPGVSEVVDHVRLVVGHAAVPGNGSKHATV